MLLYSFFYLWYLNSFHFLIKLLYFFSWSWQFFIFHYYSDDCFVTNSSITCIAYIKIICSFAFRPFLQCLVRKIIIEKILSQSKNHDTLLNKQTIFSWLNWKCMENISPACFLGNCCLSYQKIAHPTTNHQKYLWLLLLSSWVTLVLLGPGGDSWKQPLHREAAKAAGTIQALPAAGWQKGHCLADPLGALSIREQTINTASLWQFPQLSYSSWRRICLKCSGTQCGSSSSSLWQRGKNRF